MVEFTTQAVAPRQFFTLRRKGSLPSSQQTKRFPLMHLTLSFECYRVSGSSVANRQEGLSVYTAVLCFHGHGSMTWHRLTISLYVSIAGLSFGSGDQRSGPITIKRFNTHGWGPLMAKATDHDSDFRPEQLVLFGAAIIILLIFAWTYLH